MPETQLKLIEFRGTKPTESIKLAVFANVYAMIDDRLRRLTVKTEKYQVTIRTRYERVMVADKPGVLFTTEYRSGSLAGSASFVVIDADIFGARAKSAIPAATDAAPAASIRLN